MDARRERPRPKGRDVRQAAARAAARRAPHRDDVRVVVPGRAAPIPPHRVRHARGARVLFVGRGRRVYGRVQEGVGERVQDRRHRARGYARVSPLFMFCAA